MLMCFIQVRVLSYYEAGFYQVVLTLYKAVACILPLKGTVTETGGGSYIATIDK